jgi:hypothetical protein
MINVYTLAGVWWCVVVCVCVNLRILCVTAARKLWIMIGWESLLAGWLRIYEVKSKNCHLLLPPLTRYFLHVNYDGNFHDSLRKFSSSCM